jgi:RNA polymerase sigma-70 factor (ECF subfamily)
VSNRSADEGRLRAAFEQHSTRVLAYALRHTDPATAHDVVADVFLVAWRRIDDMPDEPLPWLLVVARNFLHNRRRSATRQQRLADKIGRLEEAARTAPGAEETAVERASVLAVLGELSDAEREALLLVAWDGLAPAAAAVVAGCSHHAFEVRLHRARARLRRLLPDDAEPVRRGPSRPRIVKELPL